MMPTESMNDESLPSSLVADDEAMSMAQGVASEPSEQWSRFESGEYARVTTGQPVDSANLADGEQIVVARDAQAALGSKKYLYNGLPYYLYLIRKQIRAEFMQADPQKLAAVRGSNSAGSVTALTPNVDTLSAVSQEAVSANVNSSSLVASAVAPNIAPNVVTPNVIMPNVVLPNGLDYRGSVSTAAANRLQLMQNAQSAPADELPQAVEPNQAQEGEVADAAPALMPNEVAQPAETDQQTSDSRRASVQSDSRADEAAINRQIYEKQVNNSTPEAVAADVSVLPEENAQHAAASAQVKTRTSVDTLAETRVDQSSTALPDQLDALVENGAQPNDAGTQDQSQSQYLPEQDQLAQSFDDIEEGGSFEFRVADGTETQIEEAINPHWRGDAAQADEAEDTKLSDGMNVNATLGDVILESITADSANRKVVIVDNHRLSAELHRLVSHVETLYYQEGVGDGGSTTQSSENGVAMQLKEGRFQQLGNATLKLRFVNGTLEVSFECEQAHGVEFLEQNKETLMLQLSERFDGNVRLVINGAEMMPEGVDTLSLEQAEISSDPADTASDTDADSDQDDEDDLLDEVSAEEGAYQADSMKRVVRGEGTDQEL
jgi:hypothetical protein